MWRSARAALLRANDRSQRSSNRRRVPAPVYQPGQRDWLLAKDLPIPTTSRKLAARYVGPYTVERIIKPTALSVPDAFLNYYLDTCVFTSSELPDIEYIRSLYFNKIEYLRFNSTVGKWVGYDHLGIYIAERFNNDPTDLAEMRAQKETYCKHNIDGFYRDTLDKTAEPSVRLTSVTPPSGRHPAMLMCSVYNFYPKYISVTWLRDGQPVTSDVTSTDELANGDWYYQIHSHLEYTPRSGEKITCMVEHASFPSPKKVDWNPSMPQSDRNKIASGASGLLLGLILSLAGLIYYKRKARGRVLVPTT
ncbi:H-2 class II histocompatibility antigen, E-S beta chain-like [Lampris incognitus]|uniref:H-2 class II histocompatibility antigen, E-S beta chain-like n=1 Tax=Lampris incognitus TaxID=2546036 RepID=UPI0024B5631F|nr:H-2 class II histocompatibility antigen, E-S beta chain-like [Lampris incognitus]